MQQVWLAHSVRPRDAVSTEREAKALTEAVVEDAFIKVIGHHTKQLLYVRKHETQAIKDRVVEGLKDVFTALILDAQDRTSKDSVRPVISHLTHRYQNGGHDWQTGAKNA